MTAPTTSEPQACARHGTPTRLTCAECATPICPECLVRTPVGLKCAEHAEAVPVPQAKRTANPKRALLWALAGVAVVGGVVALARTGGGSSGGPAPVVVPSPDKIRTPQVAIMDADGGNKRLLTNRPLAFDAAPAWSPDGARIAFESVVDGKRSIWVMQADGEGIRRLTDGNGDDSSPAWSPDGARIAFMSDRDGNPEVYVMNADGSGVQRLTNVFDQDGYPAWSPDGSRIAFVSGRDGGKLKIWTMAPDGTGVSRLLDVPVVAYRPAYSRDGKRIVFTSDRDGSPDLYIADADGTGLTRLAATPSAEGEPTFSPSGTEIAFASDRDGTPSIYAMGVDGSNVRKLTTGPRGFTPAWSPDGRTILYISDAGS